MAIVGLEWLILFILLIVIIYTIYRLVKSFFSRKKKILQNVILALLRTKGEVSLDDIIIATHASIDEINDALMELMAHRAVKPVNRNGETRYTI